MTSTPPSGRQSAWLFSAPVDLAAFGGSAVVSLGLLWVGAVTGAFDADTPGWAWVPAILLVDVAHVYATAFRVYFDRDELQRRPLLYFAVPLAGFVIGWALYSEGELLFWRVLAYLAVFHFVRQQYGWVALYRARAGERDRFGHRLDSAAVYLATIFPLVYWHAHLDQKHFYWLLKDDFQAIPALSARLLEPVYWSVLAAWAVRAVWRHRQGLGNPGKELVVVTTAVCWHVGIITFSSDYAFTVTNVIIHGVPYIVLVYWYMRARQSSRSRPAGIARTLFVLIATIWVLAYAEELLWDRSVWKERSWLFGSALEIGAFESVLVPLLAVPQLTHYILDGFIWKRRNNPHFTLVNSTAAPPECCSEPATSTSTPAAASSTEPPRPA